MIILIQIECECNDNLGAKNDLYYLNNYIATSEIKKSYIFTTNILDENFITSNFKNHKQIIFDTNDKLIYKMELIFKFAGKSDIVMVHIAGHGMQRVDFSGDEPDKLDEYIRVKNGQIVTDDDFQLLFSKFENKIIGLCDTCHSGSMFDKCKNMLYIGACADHQTEKCHIGKKLGYGGFLTILIVENDLYADIINSNIESLKKKMCKVFNSVGQQFICYGHK